MILAFLRTLVVAGAAACMVTLVLIDQDPRSHAYLVVTVRSLLQQAMQAPTHVVFKKLRVGLGKAVIGQVHIAAADKSWSWDTEALDLHFSLLHFVQSKKLVLRAVLKNSEVISHADNEGIAIVPAIKRLFSAGNTSQNISVSHVTIIKNKVVLSHAAGVCSAWISADLPLVGRGRTSYIWWYNGDFNYDRYHLIDRSEGLYRYDHEEGKTFVDHTACFLPFHPAKQIIEGSAICEKGIWNIQAVGGDMNDASLSLSVTVNNNENDIQGSYHIPLAWIYNVSQMVASGFSQHCRGKIEGVFSAQLNNLMDTLRVSCDLCDGALHGNALPACSAALERTSKETLINLRFADMGKFAVVIKPLEHEYSVDARAVDDIIFMPGVSVKQGSSLHITVHRQGTYGGFYSITCSLKDVSETMYTGSIKGSLTDIILSGLTQHYAFSIGASIQGAPHITQATVHDEEHTPLLQLAEDKDTGMLTGFCDVRLISLLASLLSDNKVSSLMLGEGACTFDGAISTKEINGLITLSAGSTIRIPYFYNILEELSMQVHVDWSSKQFHARDIVLKLHRGALYISQAQGAWNNKGLSYATMPYIAHNCLVSWRKNLFALLSGGGMLSYSPEGSYVKGFWIVEKGHMRNNILSTEFASQTTSHAPSQDKYKEKVHLDVMVMTRKPIHVKTSFLETRVGAHAIIHGTLDRPLIKGDVTLLEGSLLFPYKPLFIRQGTVSLRSADVNVGNHLMSNVLKYSNGGYESFVNLIAENTIKGYRIRLQAQGPIQNPELIFSAAPHLPPEQVIALLFAGSEDGSIYVAMSTYIMQSIKQLLFGPTDGSSTILQSLNNLFRPLGSVRFVPSFTDQSSRGGIRGSLTLEVNDRLRGMIKQNFDLPQDVMLEVEYDLSDDARIRAIKDERGDLGAEIEASWKF